MKPLKNHNSPITSKMTIKHIDLLEWVLLPEKIEYIRCCARGEEYNTLCNINLWFKPYR